MVTTLPGTNIQVPEPEDLKAAAGGHGGYTGFNGTTLDEAYVCRRFPARRSQIARGFGKPIIQRLPSGDLMATGIKPLRDAPNPKYPDAREEAMLAVSHDEGETWSDMRPLDIPERPTQYSVLSDGTQILAVGSRIYRSEDDGQTFEQCPVPWEDFAGSRDGLVYGFGETNGVIEMPDGHLVTTCCVVRRPIEHYDDFNCYLLRSTDGGRSWGDTSFIINTDEISLVLPSEGRLLGLARLDTRYSDEVWGQGGQIGEGGDQMSIIESTDAGRTWSDPVPIAGLGMGQIPGFPLLLPDSRLLMVYGNRRFPFGVQAIASYDHGKTWNTEHFLMLAFASWDNYGGHPRSILMPDGSIITGYYARYFKDHPKTVSGDLVSHCLRWRVPDNWPPCSA